jgi:hypothetical protein
LDDSTVDYTASPWVLRDTFEVHCIVVIDIDSNEVFKFVQAECYEQFPKWAKENVGVIIGHNIINFDLLACKAAFGMDYTVGPDTWQGESVEIIDTYVLSKTLNPDRRGHSMDYFGELLGLPKIDWRAKAVEIGLIEANAPRAAEFKTYHPEMLVYNERDVVVNIKTYRYLMNEWGDWNWTDAYELEKAVAEIITRQSHRGFWFDSDLAKENVRELDILMAERKAIVEPALPAKPMGKTKLKEYIPGAKQFKMNGEPDANIHKWCAKHGGTIEKVGDIYQTTLHGKTYTLPIPQEPIVSTEPSNIDDSTFIKGFLVELGWKPTQYKERDLTVDTKKQKLSAERFAETVERYVEQTLNSPFCADRCERVNCSPKDLRTKLLKHDMKKPLKVYTNPTFTVGQEKEIDPALEEMKSTFPHVQNIVEYLTYKHRRNSILGGGLDPDDLDEEDDVTGKGFLANVRSDGRIPTPADTCGAATGRFKHKICVNVPRVTTLYGEPMRKMFGVGDTKRYAQFAFDFASLENRVQSHFCWRYDESKNYCNSLILEKPLDSHTQTAKKVSEVIGQLFSRQSAKSVGYACVYGAQAARVAKTVGCDLHLGQKIFDAFWQASQPLAELKERLTQYWKTTGQKKFILGLDGRKINTRSEHALLNSLFQSSGIIGAKRTMVYQEKLMGEMGITVDFWKDDWRTKSYAQQIMHAHDEAQFEVTKDLIQWKMFKEETECKDFVANNPEWVGPGRSERGYFAALSPVNTVVRKAVDLTNAYYKMRVPLAVDPQYGRNWAECH